MDFYNLRKGKYKNGTWSDIYFENGGEPLKRERIIEITLSRDDAAFYSFLAHISSRDDAAFYSFLAHISSRDDAAFFSFLAHISVRMGILLLLLSLPSPRQFITSFDPPLFVLDGLLFSYYFLIGLSLHLSVQFLKKIMKPMLKTLAISLKNKGIISVSSKFESGKNREQRPLVDFDSTNNRACQSGLLVSNSDKTNAREASKGPCMTEEGALSLVDSTTRISSTDFDAPENGARLVRANQSGPITLNSEEKDTSEGLIGECLTESVLRLDDSTKRKSFPDFDATENKAHLVRAYQRGHVVSQFARSSPQPLGLLDGCVIVGPIALSSSDFAATNNRAHFVRQDQSSSTASCREGKSARETLDRQGITMSLCIVDDLQQHFGGKHKDAMKRLGVNISMFKSTCKLHQFYWQPCWSEKNEQVFDTRNNRTHLAKADQSGPTMSNSKKENTREALKRECVTSRVFRHLVRPRTLTHKHCVRRKKSQDLPRSLQMDCSGGLATQKSTRCLHWPLGLPDGGPMVSHSEKKIVRNTFKRKCRRMSVSFEDHQQHFCSRCEGAANSLGAKRNCKRHGINLVSTTKCIHRQHGIHRCPFRQGYSLGRESPAEVISLSMDDKLVLRLQFLHMSWLARSLLHPFALRSGREIVGYIAFSSSEFAATNNRAHPGGQDRCGSSASRPENERTKETKNGEGTASRIISREVLEQHFGSKREDVAKILGYSVSTFKRVCRDHGIPRWPNRRSNYVRRPPDPHREKNPSPTVNTLSTNAQITMEMGGQNSEPNECLPDSFEDPNFQNTGTGSIAEFGKTPTFHDSLLGHCRDADICFPAVYSETDAAGGSSKWAFPLEGQTTQSTASPNRNALVFPQSQIASTKVLYQNIGSAEDRRDLFASQVEAYLEGHVSDAPVATILHTMPTIPHTMPHLIGGSPELMFQQKNQSMQFTAYPNGLVDPHPHMASTQKISENMRSLDDRRNLLAPQKEPLPEEHVFGSVNWTVGSCSSLAPSQPMPTIPHTAGSSEYWRNSLAFVEGHLMGGNLYGSFNLTVPPSSDPASQPMPTIHHTMATVPRMMPLLTERPDTRSVKLKAIYGDTTIKFQVPLTSGINELKEEVSKILECKLGSFNVEYKDEDGDWILMASDENVSEYLQLLTSLGNQERG